MWNSCLERDFLNGNWPLEAPSLHFRVVAVGEDGDVLQVEVGNGLQTDVFEVGMQPGKAW